MRESVLACKRMCASKVNKVFNKSKEERKRRKGQGKKGEKMLAYILAS